MKRNKRKKDEDKKRTMIWVNPEFKRVRDRAAADCDMKKEEVTERMSKILMEDYDDFVNLLGDDLFDREERGDNEDAFRPLF